MQQVRFKALHRDQIREVEVANNSITVDGKTIDWELEEISHDRFHIISNGKSFECFLIAVDYEKKAVDLLVNNHHYTIELRDRYDELLKQLGMTDMGSGKLSDLKAPMPGLVLKILVKEGETISKGDSLIVLEAMKMENMLKSQGNGVIKSIKVQPGNTVEKGTLLIQFD